MIMWGWKNRRAVIECVHQEVEQARIERLKAERRREESRALAEKSNAVTAKLRKEIAINGFTELLQSAMGRR